MVRHTSKVHDGLFDAVQQYIYDNTFISAFHGGALLPVLLGGGIGFLSGLMCKQLGKYFIVGSLIIGIIGVLQYVEILSISIQYANLSRLLGVQLGTTSDQVVTMCMTWMRTHVAQVMGFLVGFFLGVFFG